MAFLSAVPVVMVVFLGLLIMVRGVEITEVFTALGQALLCGFWIVVAFCAVRILLICIIFPSFQVFLAGLARFLVRAVLILLSISIVWAVTNVVAGRGISGISKSNKRGEP